ncbi:DNA topoisomerase VI subunit B [Candidatus Woesearchaeota archaeon CG11_big_fil_rev_8_21_14_0_20_43_8]|nr:MAG: DNA topoisomerase VI subunit B [Candidatus Woesearchaeota archaeon CG11_big_fil_rev_8_21_14_0_20_43_8]PIO05552.1 MAG: DNA topoisomerase VI subunit B [Candidatus Woesearchaeota archaeon CG08_land_8_20_14_0_20_43_7]
MSQKILGTFDDEKEEDAIVKEENPAVQEGFSEEYIQERKSKAQEMASKQRDISVAEFFEKNRHLLGFDNPRKALLTTIKEAVDNAIDACEEGGLLPEIIVEIIDMQNGRFRIIVEDNGPGIVKKQIPNIFAKLLYGSKFHSLKQSRGQQGIGISAAVLYSQLTTGRPAKIRSKIAPTEPAHYFELHIDTQKNKPEIIKEDIIEWKKDHGTRVEMDLEATYQKGAQGVDEYIKQTAIVNPHITIIYTNPKAEQTIFARVSEQLPPQAKEIKPHPYGVEIGRMAKMLAITQAKTLQQFLMSEFSRVGAKAVKEICENSALLPKDKPSNLTRQHVEKLIKGIKETKLISPPTDCINPITAELIEIGLRKEINAEFFCSATRPPNVYRGNPFIIEAGIAYGGDLDKEKTIRIMRFANRVPLLYQQGACAMTQSVQEVSWRSYGLSQSQNSIPAGPAVVVVHIASVWTPYTSEAKEAIAHYPEIVKEIKLALQECGRKLGLYVSKKRRIMEEGKKKSYIEKYLPHIGAALKEIVGFSDVEERRIHDILKEILEKSRKADGGLGRLSAVNDDPGAGEDDDILGDPSDDMPEDSDDGSSDDSYDDSAEETDDEEIEDEETERGAGQ